MAIRAEGHGFSVAHGDLTISQNPTEIQIPGFAREELPRTTQANTGVHTSDLSVLAKFEDFTHTFEFDPVDYERFRGDTTNRLQVITFPASAGTFSIWCRVKNIATIPAAGAGQRMLMPVTFHPTNRNGSDVETAPDFVSGS
jgi:hypothetical protein